VLLREAETMGLEIAPLNGEKLTTLVARVASTPPEVVQRAERAARAE